MTYVEHDDEVSNSQTSYNQKYDLCMYYKNGLKNCREVCEDM
jgi:hypothetical protein